MFRDPINWSNDVGCVQAAIQRQAIGKIQTVIGSVTVIRAGGVVVQVDAGDPVYQGDTIETGADGAVGMTFADGTAFNLSSNARMVLNEFVRDRNGNSNSTLFSLLQGAFAFIAGKAARPAASKSIRLLEGSEAPRGTVESAS